MSASHPNQSTPILIQPSSWKTKTYDAREEERMRRLIRDEILVKRHEPYYQARATIKYHADGKPDRIIAYLLRSNTYTADVIKAKVDENYHIVSVTEAPDLAPEDEAD